MFRAHSLLKILTVAGIACCATASANPILYLFDGDDATGLIVNTGNSTYTTFDTFNLGYPVAIVDNTILLHSRNDESSGAAYDLSGNPTGQTWAGNNSPVDQLLDGTSNGSNNFAIQCCAGTNVWEASLTWQNFTPLFTFNGTANGGSGITYVPSSDSLYVVDFGGNLYQYSLSGTLLNSYSSISGGINAGLSFDPATSTLWGVQNGTDSIVQESLTGTVLQTLTVTGISDYNIFGGEIAGVSAVPEPASTALIAVGLFGIAFLAKRRKLIQPN